MVAAIKTKTDSLPADPASQSAVKRPLPEPFNLPPSHPHPALHAIFQATPPLIYQEHTDINLSAHPAHIENPVRRRSSIRRPP
jgi:hypothetical protein